MKYHNYCKVLLAGLLALSLLGCSLPNNKTTDVETKESLPLTSESIVDKHDNIQGLFYPLDQFPLIDSFSGTELECYENDRYEQVYQFPTIDAAFLYANGEGEQISSDDSRLLRLLNSIAFSKQEKTDTYLQGIVDEKEVQDCFEKMSLLLEVTFNPKEENQGILSDLSKIIICKDCCYEYYGSIESVQIIEKHWPFLGRLQKALQSDKGMTYFYKQMEIDSSDDTWLDLLTYADFQDKNVHSSTGDDSAN